jgi:Fe2+ or Zn2+ uptake regulation protein
VYISREEMYVCMYRRRKNVLLCTVYRSLYKMARDVTVQTQKRDGCAHAYKTHIDLDMLLLPD